MKKRIKERLREGLIKINLLENKADSKLKYELERLDAMYKNGKIYKDELRYEFIKLSDKYDKYYNVYDSFGIVDAIKRLIPYGPLDRFYDGMLAYVKESLSEDLEYYHFDGGKLGINENGGDYGYHAGDLSYKSGLLSQNAFIKTLKSQLGTGYFFFGDLNDALELAGVKKSATSKIKELEKTKIYKADFSKYKLLKPSSASEFYDNLIIPMVKALNQLEPDDLNDPEIIEGMADLADYYRSFGVNISDDEFIDIVYGYLVDMENKSSQSDEVINTRILKSAGFEGVDLRNTEKDGLVNGRAGVGSVLFDIKPGTVELVEL